jgi:hypothetical protein
VQGPAIQGMEVLIACPSMSAGCSNCLAMQLTDTQSDGASGPCRRSATGSKSLCGWAPGPSMLLAVSTAGEW